jgi:hypothetical protein
MPESTKELSGRELNFAIAEKVMGWKRGTRYGNGNGEWIIPDRKEVLPLTWSRTPQFCESIEAAMQVVAKLEKDNMISLTHFANLPSESKWIVALSSCAPGYIDVRGESDTLPEAICRAALAAIGE